MIFKPEEIYLNKEEKNEYYEKLKKLLTAGNKMGVSDFHFSTGEKIIFRIDGDIKRIKNEEAFTLDEARKLIFSCMNEDQIEDFAKKRDVDLAIEVEGLARFRVNVFEQHRGTSSVFRTIPTEILNMEQLGMGDNFKEISSAPRGLILVTGPTGSGKSTTLAAMIDYINETKSEHILTVEDPIEFVHKSKSSLISQREVYRDTESFESSLKAALREDPDIILVGEMRDLETIKLALTAAETGHLVMGTLHTTSAAKTIDRIVDVFPAEEKDMIRSMVAESLKAIISQTLIKKEGGGRIAAHEILIGTSAIKSLIKENKIAQIYSSMQTGSKYGMLTLENSLIKHYKDGKISYDNALQKANIKDEIKKLKS
jgi:twitching motility protein PilT